MSGQQKLPHMTSKTPGKTTTVHCCYCNAKQAAPMPPSLHTCVSCGRDFRVYANVAKAKPIEITERARNFFAKTAPGNGTESA
jgi:hypothetical protein